LMAQEAKLQTAHARQDVTFQIGLWERVEARAASGPAVLRCFPAALLRLDAQLGRILGRSYMAASPREPARSNGSASSNGSARSNGSAKSRGSAKLNGSARPNGSAGRQSKPRQKPKAEASPEPDAITTSITTAGRAPARRNGQSTRKQANKTKGNGTSQSQQIALDKQRWDAWVEATGDTDHTLELAMLEEEHPPWFSRAAGVLSRLRSVGSRPG
jgi:hypothetical protein